MNYAVLKKGTTLIGGINPSVTEFDPGWSKPVQWMTLPEPSPGEQKIVGLYGIPDDESAFASILATTSTGQYRVDWGDGTSTLHNSNTLAAKRYNYSTITDSLSSSTTLTEQGFRQAIITVTPTTGNLQTISFSQPPSSTVPTNWQNDGTLTNYWLDVFVNGPFITSFKFYQSNGMSSTHLERVRVGRLGTLTDVTNMFQGCRNLRSINLSSIGSATNVNNLFNTCSELKEIPTINFSSVISASDAFFGCTSLTTIHSLNLSACRDMTRMFSGCFSLRKIPFIDSRNGILMSNMFVNCASLEYIPLLITSNATTTANMFDGCRSLKTIPPLDISKSTTVESMFTNCTSLESIPQLNPASATTALRMFSNCSSLKKIPPMSFPKCNNFTDFANSCAFLEEVGPLSATSPNLSGATIMSNFLNGARNVRSSIIYGVSANLNFGTSTGALACVRLSRQAIVNIFNALPTLTGANTATVNVARNIGTPFLTTADLNIARNKGWITLSA